MALDQGSAPRRAVTAFFDDRAAAQRAVDDLVAAGLPREAITLVEGGAEPVAAEAVPTADKGFWATLRDMFMAEEDRHAYGEGLRRGGFLLSAETSATDHARAVEVLDREGAVDMDARQSDWEAEGWDAARASEDLRSSAVADLEAAEPLGAGGLASGREGDAPGRPTVSRDGDSRSLRLRTYVEAHDHPDPMR